MDLFNYVLSISYIKINCYNLLLFLKVKYFNNYMCYLFFKSKPQRNSDNNNMFIHIKNIYIYQLI